MNEERLRLEAEMYKKLSTQKGRLELWASMWCPMVRSYGYGESPKNATMREYVSMVVKADPENAEGNKETIKKILESDK